jgi:hypothetical protein
MIPRFLQKLLLRPWLLSIHRLLSYMSIKGFPIPDMSHMILTAAK